MKKLLVLVWIFIAVLFSNFSFVEAWIFSNNSNSNSIPYCKWNECSLEKGIEESRWQVENIYDGSKWASKYIQDILIYLLWFLYFIGVVIIIYAWFTILTANWDEEKVSKAKKIILYVIIGMIVIFLAGPITNFILDMFKSAK